MNAAVSNACVYVYRSIFRPRVIGSLGTRLATGLLTFWPAQFRVQCLLRSISPQGSATPAIIFFNMDPPPTLWMRRGLFSLAPARGDTVNIIHERNNYANCISTARWCECADISLAGSKNGTSLFSTTSV